MKVLALDSSGLTASVAVVSEGALLGEYTINYKKTHSQTLLPMLKQVADMIELDLQTVDAIAVAAGPGSFTGLRIGSATAKGIGLALGKPIIPVPTVDALAYNLWGCTSMICPIMDARRNQVYTGLYEFVPADSVLCDDIARPEDDGCGNDAGNDVKETAGIRRTSDMKLHVILPECALAVEDIIKRINEAGRPTAFLGDGVPVFRDIIEEQITVEHYYTPPMSSMQRAASVGALGILLYKEGHFEDAAAHSPNYLRQSQAEREFAGHQRDFQI